MAKRRPIQEPTITRIPIGDLVLFEITEDELAALECGSPESLFLNFAIAFFSIAVSFSLTLTTASFTNDRTFDAIVIVMSVAYVASIAFIIFRLISRRSIKYVSARIRSRVPSNEAIQDNSIHSIESD